VAEEREPRLGVAAGALALYVGCRIIEIVLEAQSLAAMVGQSVLVEFGAARLGVEWRSGDVPGRATRGAAMGVVLAAVVFGILVATRSVLFVAASAPASLLVLGLGSAVLVAWREELLLHGLTFRVVGDGLPPIGAVLACGATSAGAALGRPDATARTVVVAALLGILFGALWARDRGAWAPVAAHAAFRYATGTLLAGGVLGARLRDDAWAGGGHGLQGGTAAVVALAPLASLALVWVATRVSRPEAGKES
jgi:membrane protease YdiL (CAAX protease family)